MESIQLKSAEANYKKGVAALTYIDSLNLK